MELSKSLSPCRRQTSVLRWYLAWRHTVNRGLILVGVQNSSVCVFVVSSLRKYRRCFLLSQEKKKNAVFYSISLHFHHAPCPVCQSVCGMPLSFGVFVCVCVFHWDYVYFITSFFLVYFPPSRRLTFCLSKGRHCMFVCVCARPCTRPWMCAKCHCHSSVWRIFMAEPPIGPMEECVTGDGWKGWGKEDHETNVDETEMHWWRGPSRKRTKHTTVSLDLTKQDYTFLLGLLIHHKAQALC